MSLPALVEPVTTLPAGENARQAHQLILGGFGSAGQRRLAAARVLVVGADEVGGPLLAHLADSGIGTLGIVDGAAMRPWDEHFGIPQHEAGVRAEAWAAGLRRTHPAVRTEMPAGRFDAAHGEELVAGYDLVACAAEDPARCRLVDDVCARAGIPYVWGDMGATRARVAVFWDRHGPGWRDLNRQRSAPYFRGMSGNLRLLGAWLAVTMSAEVVKLVTGTGEPLVGRVLTYDLQAGESAVEPVTRDRSSMRPATLTAAEPFFGLLSPEAAEAAREATISATDLCDLLHGDEPIALVDVREPDEYDFVHLPGSALIPKAQFLDGDAADRLPRDRKVVLLCRVGIRSAEVLAVVRKSGHPDAVHLGGGILAWAEQVDGSMPVY